MEPANQQCWQEAVFFTMNKDVYQVCVVSSATINIHSFPAAANACEVSRGGNSLLCCWQQAIAGW